MKDRSPIVTVIVAVYNGGKTLENCLKSIAKQTYPNKELIIIDGGSTDSSVDILKRYEDHIDYWVSEPDQGIYDAWNKGLKQAAGEWIAFIGSDDQYTEDSILSEMISFLSDKPEVEYLSGIAGYYYPDGTFRRFLGSAWDWTTFKRSAGKVVHPGSLHRKSLFLKYGQFDTSYRIAGDYDFLLRSGPNLKAAFFPHQIMRIGMGGASSRYAVKTLGELLKIQKITPHISDAEAYFNYLFILFKYMAGKIKFGLVRWFRKPLFST